MRSSRSGHELLRHKGRYVVEYYRDVGCIAGDAERMIRWRYHMLMRRIPFSVKRR